MKQQYDSIQVLRAVAVLWVVGFHMAVTLRIIYGDMALQFIAGAAGVDLFFVISGFVMVYSTHNTWGASGIARKFMLRRLIRIVPLYWMVTTLKLTLLIQSGHVQTLNWHVIASYLFIPARDYNGEFYPLYIPGWSLSYEMLFYVLFALMLWLRKPPVTLISLLFLALAFIGEWGILWRPQLLLGFVFGMWTAVFVLKGWRLSESVAWSVLLFELFFLMSCRNMIQHDEFAAYRWLFYGVPCAMLVFAAVSLEKSRLWRIRLFTMTGVASYSIYLSHEFVITMIGAVLIKYRWPVLESSILSYVCVAPLSIMLGIMLHFMLEKPVIHFLRTRCSV